jgi:hypothetical protein
MSYPPGFDPTPVLDGLKDFQRRTVDYVFQRLYRDADPADRFLIADEVGLGKTLVARGLIAKTIEHLWPKVECREIQRIDIVYICSNAEIARQNIQRLNVTGKRDFNLASRITLLPTQLQGLQQNKVNFVSFTPGTSFDMKSSLGLAEERILLHQLLEKIWHFGDKAGPLNIFQGTCGRESFRNQVWSFKHYRHIDPTLAAAFHDLLQERIEQDRATGQADFRTRFDDLCDRFARSRHHVPDEDRYLRNRFVGDLRGLLARACISALEPDLIILDEFQRFKHLLDVDETNEVSQLAHDLFSYQDANSSVKVLLLSATPYKMYTMAHEQADDNHYSDFLQTLEFLKGSAQGAEGFADLLGQYRKALLQIDGQQLEGIIHLKSQLEQELRQVMVRTERLSASTDRNGMLTEIASSTTKLEEQDLRAYLDLQQLTQVLKHHNTLEYWKSAPYLLNFMERNYEIKRSLERVLGEDQTNAALAKILAQSDSLLLSQDDIARYQTLDPCNARLRGLLADTVGNDTWQLLWMPPAMPYYQLGGPFAQVDGIRLTKRLIFSAWQVVPKVISTLLSYEAERRMVSAFEDRPENSQDARSKRGQLLRFGKSNDRLSGMPVLGLLYPSTVLARECDSLIIAAQQETTPDLESLLEQVSEKVQRLIDQLDIETKETGAEDESWYWMAPILLDKHFDPHLTEQWFTTKDLPQLWQGIDDVTADGAQNKLWSEHVRWAQQIFEIYPYPSLGKPPADLARVVAQLAIASPAITALRSLMRVIGDGETVSRPEIRCRASQIAWSFRSLFNQPEVTNLLRGMNPEEPYWRRVLDYCCNGGLQAVLDEYMHILRESLGATNTAEERLAEQLAETISQVLSLRTSVMKVDDVQVYNSRVDIPKDGFRMRGHFALPFGQQQAEGNDNYLNRAEHVRDAFNSPFRPFVLATTSVGQEGLDFHPYCHAIVHWNLPTNPVDLEQREGRVHRYKGHAVRKNLALQYGTPAIDRVATDPWQWLFDVAIADRSDEVSDLVPFWIYPKEGGAKIERHVPNLPLSRDCERLTALKRSLAVYRMVFGQNRQEDLVAYLLNSLSDEEIEGMKRQLCISLEPL